MSVPTDPEAFRKEMAELREKYERELDLHIEKFKDDPTPHCLDGGPGTGEWKEIVRRLFADVHRVRRKYGFKQ